MYMIFSLLLGYAFGNILTAEIVIRKALGKTVFEVGTGNPGMANVMARVSLQLALRSSVCSLQLAFFRC